MSTRLRYGTRLLIDLGVHSHDGPVFLKDIAKRQRVSKKYLEQIVTGLKTAGLVRTMRGSKGGYCLAKDPRTMRLIEIYNILEGSTALVDCLDNPEACPYDLVDTCPTKDTWGKLRIAVEKILEDVTLADLIRDWEKKNSQSL